MKQPVVFQSMNPVGPQGLPSEDMARKVRKLPDTRRRLAAGLIATFIIAALAGSFVTYRTGRSLFGQARTAPLEAATL